MKAAPLISSRSMMSGGNVLMSSKISPLQAAPQVPLTSLQRFIEGSIGIANLDQFRTCYDVAASFKIGAGTHSDVIQARSKRTGMDRAVKVVSVKDLDANQVRQEVRAMQSVRHLGCSPNPQDVLVCSEQLPNVRSNPPYVCIVMEFIQDAETLSSVLRKGGNPQLAHKMLSQIAGVLAELHTRRFVHGDVWCENMLVNRSGSAYLIDFSCARYLDAPVDSKASVVNIPYASPQLCSGQQLCPSDDCWALGLTLTEIVTGRPISHRMNQTDVPFFSKAELLDGAIAETVTSGGHILGKICVQLLKKDATQRATARDVLGLLSNSARMHVNESAVLPVSTTYKRIATRSTFEVGQQVSYQASSHNAVYMAFVIGKTSGGGWQIQIPGAPIKEVPAAEEWRLSAVGA